MDGKRLVGVVAVAAVVLAGLAVLDAGNAGQGKQGLGNAHEVNVSGVSYRVSVGKPGIAMFAEAAQDLNAKSGSELTVYNSDLALVKDVRWVNLVKGVNEVEFGDVAARIDPTSVLFRDLSFPDTYVEEQDYEYDTVSQSKILEKYLGSDITVGVTVGNESKEYTGKLLSYANGIILDTNSGIVSLSSQDRVVFPSLPRGLLTKPTLVWKLWSGNDGERQTETVYLTGGLSWKADYVAVESVDDKSIDLSGWATVTNSSGTDYPDTKLKLVAGDVHRVQEGAPYAQAFESAVKAGAAAPQQFGTQPLFEYYLYTLQGRTDVRDNETKQISLLTADSVPVEKEYVFDSPGYPVYYGAGSSASGVAVKLVFKDSERQGLGVPLPDGTVRVYKKDSDGQLQFIGEDTIGNTKKDDEVSILVGNAFDVTGERTQVSSENPSKGVTRETYKVVFKNEKDEAVSIVDKEHFYATGWAISGNNLPYEKKSSTEADFVVGVPAHGTAELDYVVEYRNYY